MGAKRPPVQRPVMPPDTGRPPNADDMTFGPIMISTPEMRDAKRAKERRDLEDRLKAIGPDGDQQLKRNLQKSIFESTPGSRRYTAKKMAEAAQRRADFAAGKEGATFDAKQYLANYKDLQEAFGDDEQKARQHYLEYGIKENRTDRNIGTKTPKTPLPPKPPEVPPGLGARIPLPIVRPYEPNPNDFNIDRRPIVSRPRDPETGKPTLPDKKRDPKGGPREAHIDRRPIGRRRRPPTYDRPRPDESPIREIPIREEIKPEITREFDPKGDAPFRPDEAKMARDKFYETMFAKAENKKEQKSMRREERKSRRRSMRSEQRMRDNERGEVNVGGEINVGR